jgi:hypothetical protein
MQYTVFIQSTLFKDKKLMAYIYRVITKHLCSFQRSLSFSKNSRFEFNRYYVLQKFKTCSYMTFVHVLLK